MIELCLEHLTKTEEKALADIQIQIDGILSTQTDDLNSTLNNKEELQAEAQHRELAERLTEHTVFMTDFYSRLEGYDKQIDALKEKRIEIKKKAFKRYVTHTKGVEALLLEDAKRIAYSATIDDYFKNCFSVLPLKEEATEENAIYRQGMQLFMQFIYYSMLEVKAAADHWKVDIDSQLKEIAEQAARDIIKKAYDTLERVAIEEVEPITITLNGEPIPKIEKPQPVEKKQPLAVLEDLIKSKSYTALNSKVFNSYANLQDMLSIENDGQLTFIQEKQEVRISPQRTAGTQQDVITLVGLDYSGELPAKLAKLSAYDKTVLNTLCSIWQAGNTTTTINSIFKVMNGNTDREPRENQRKKLLASLNKLSDTKIFIDFTDEIKKSYIVIDEDTDERFISGTVSDRLFNFRVFTAETNRGRKVEAIQFLTEPVLLTYSKIKRNVQLVTFPTAMLDTKSLNATDSVIVIREYLAKQIALMQNQKSKRSNIILYDTLYRECTIELPTDKNRLKNETKRYRDSIDSILTEWKEQGYIKNFKANNTGRKCTGIEIFI